MKTNSLSVEVLMIGLLLAPFAYLALIWNQLPAEIATHYDLRGHADGWMKKETAMLVMGGLSAFLYWLLRYLPQIDPKGRLQSSNYQKLRFVIGVFFAGITAGMWYMADHPVEKQYLLTPLLALVGLLLAGMGNYMTTIKPNWFVGIRTPWTLQIDTVWRRTHRLGGWLMVAGGLLIVVLALVVPTPYAVGGVIGITLLVSFISIGSSYVYFQQEKARQLN